MIYVCKCKCKCIHVYIYIYMDIHGNFHGWLWWLRSLLTVLKSFRIKLLQGMPDNHVFETWPNVMWSFWNPHFDPFSYEHQVWLPANIMIHFSGDNNLELMHIWRNNLLTQQDSWWDMICLSVYLSACLSVRYIYNMHVNKISQKQYDMHMAYYIS